MVGTGGGGGGGGGLRFGSFSLIAKLRSAGGVKNSGR